MKYHIIDWAGNDKTDYYGTFKTFEEAWGRLYHEFRDLSERDYEDQLGEFYVIDSNEYKTLRKRTMLA